MPLTIHLIGTLSWVVAVIAAAVAPGQAGAPRTATIPLGQAGVIGAVIMLHRSDQSRCCSS